MTLYERICDAVYEIFYELKNHDMKNKSFFSKKEITSSSALEHIHFRGDGFAWTIKDINAYCRNPEFKKEVKKLSNYDFMKGLRGNGKR
ncbi:MAG: hypothetical protein Q8O84_05320 [Nanoarchaeota archaeon]|nr:hypothetical protein [Nanoarchaeota archaeon]